MRKGHISEKLTVAFVISGGVYDSSGGKIQTTDDSI